MPRQINANALAKLAEQYGTEPVTIIEVQWVEDGPFVPYADKDVQGIPGKIIEISPIDAIVQITRNSDSQELSIKLDDTDGTLKEIIDSNNIHNRPVRVYQWFEGLDLDDKFVVFLGYINTPIEWNERDRTLTFSVISSVDGLTVGFSIEEGAFANPPAELVGRPWPLVFGTAVNVPALRLVPITSGRLLTGVGIADPKIKEKLDMIARYRAYLCPPKNQVTFSVGGAGINNPISDALARLIREEPDLECERKLCELTEELTIALREQKKYEFKQINIFGGENFPQNQEITLYVNGARLIGKMSGNTFTIRKAIHPKLISDSEAVTTGAENEIRSTCGLPTTPAPPPPISAQLAWDQINNIKLLGFFWASPGSIVQLDQIEQVYIANLAPSTILRVAARRKTGDVTQLVTVPSTYYTVRTSDYGSYQVTEIVFSKPLSTRNEGWEDDIYVTQTSSLGPNPVDIMTWLIETYSEYEWDTASFNAVKTKLANYPMGFALLTRPNLIDLLRDLAYQARCAIWLRGGKFYLKYLAELPTPEDTIDEDDVLQDSLILFHSPTEELVTRYVATWTDDYSKEEKNKVIVLSNIAKYGSIEQEYDYFAYNVADYVEKSATFWAIRTSNIWKKIKFNSALNKLKIEVFDALSFNLPKISPSTFYGEVERAEYNSQSNEIEFEAWLPIRAGETEVYDFAHPANLSITRVWPPTDELTLAISGPLSVNFSTILHNPPPEHPLTPGVNIQDDPNRSNKGFGNKLPTDLDDTIISPWVPDEGPIFPESATNPFVNPNETENIAENALGLAARAVEDVNKLMKKFLEEEFNDPLRPTGLPPICGGHYWHVTGLWVRPTLVFNPPGSDPFFESGEGDQGRIATSEFLFTSCWTFNNKIAAKQFAEALQAEIDRKIDEYAFTVGNTELITVGVNPPDQSPPIENEVPMEMIGYVEEPF